MKPAVPPVGTKNITKCQCETNKLVALLYYRDFRPDYFPSYSVWQRGWELLDSKQRSDYFLISLGPNKISYLPLR